MLKSKSKELSYTWNNKISKSYVGNQNGKILKHTDKSQNKHFKH